MSYYIEETDYDYRYRGRDSSNSGDTPRVESPAATELDDRVSIDVPRPPREITRPHFEGSSYSSDDDSDVYEKFSLSAAYHSTPTPSPSREPSTRDESDEETDSNRGTTNAEAGNTREASDLYQDGTFNIHASEYIGDSFVDGAHSVKLTTLPQPRQRHLCFRWIHVHQIEPRLDFDKFFNTVSASSALEQSDRVAVLKFLSEVKKKASKYKTPASRIQVRYMKPMYMEQLAPVEDPSSRGQASSRRLTWLCIPYFSLEKYTGLRHQANLTAYPNQTLLQAQFSGNLEQRDMEQVVRQLGNCEPRECFHINQLWSLVIGDSVAFTCGVMNESSLRGDLVKMDPGNSVLNQNAGELARLFVRFQETIVWSFPLKDCSTWIQFVAQFSRFWPQTLQFSHQGKPVAAKDWAAKLNLARHKKVTLVLSLLPPPRPPRRGVLVRPDESIREVNAPLQPPQNGNHPNSRNLTQMENNPTRKFHAFSWLNNVQCHDENAASLQRNQPLEGHLQEVHRWLCQETTIHDIRAYKRCDEATRLSCFEYLQSQADSLLDDDKGARELHETRVDVLNAADIVFELFLPLRYDGPTVRRYWGGISALIKMSADWGSQNRVAVSNTRDFLRRLSQPIQSFQDIMAHSDKDTRARAKVPDKLITAWLRVIMGIVHSAQYNNRHDHFSGAERLLMVSLADVMRSLGGGQLAKRVCILPLDLVSLLCLRVLNDMAGKHSGIGETYSEFLKNLESIISTGQPDRSTRRRIGLLNQEISVIRKILNYQMRIVSVFLPRTSKHSEDRERDSGNARTRDRAADASYSYRRRDMVDPKQLLELSKTVAYAAERASSPPTHKRLRPSPYYSDKYGSHNVNGDGYESGNYYNGRSNITRGRREQPQEDPVLHESGSLTQEEVHKLQSVDPVNIGGFSVMFGMDCLGLIKRRHDEFAEYEAHAEILAEENSNNLSITKDRQETAIYAFTIVTIVFLPMSAVAGIFGMNTSDVRDMELGQWVYWASAIPTTAVVILLGLWWMGELGQVVAWISDRLRGRVGFVPAAEHVAAPRSSRSR